MSILTRLFVCIPLLSVPCLCAQDGAPKPAAEIQKLKPYIGNWSGTGTATLGPGSPPTKWAAQGTYRWCLADHFIQEDFQIRFEGLPTPMIAHAIHGWDAESRSFVIAQVTNRGQARFDKTTLLQDGTLVHFIQHVQDGLPYVERLRTKVDGSTLHMSIEFLMSEGAGLHVLDGVMTKTEKACNVAFDMPTFQSEPPGPQMVKLARIAGTYELKGSVVVAPGVPALKIEGVEHFETVFGGTVLYGHSDGKAEGMPDAYHAEVFWAFDEERHAFVNVFASNMGEIGTMEARFSADGKTLISTSAGTRGGETIAQRYLLHLDDSGAAVSGSSHSILGANAPSETFTATYTKR